MKVTTTKDFSNKNMKVILPLVPEPTTVAKKEDLATVDLHGNLTDANSTKVCFMFKVLLGTNESPRELIEWHKNVERAFIGLNCTTELLQHQMMRQFCRGTTLSTYNSNVSQLCHNGKTSYVADAQKAVDDYNDADPNVAAQLAQALTDAEAKTQNECLTNADDGARMASTVLNKMMTGLLPNKLLQRIKRCLRRKARKPFDMNVKSYHMNGMCINAEEIPFLLPHFSETKSLGEDDEIVDILVYGTPKSWQKVMDCQGFDPLTQTPVQVLAFMERIEASEECDSDKKTIKVATSNKGKKKSSDSNELKESHHCVLHGNNNAHDTSQCKTLQAQAKKLKGNNDGSDKNGKSHNKSWKNKAKDDAEDFKKELAFLVKKVQCPNSCTRWVNFLTASTAVSLYV